MRDNFPSGVARKFARFFTDGARRRAWLFRLIRRGGFQPYNFTRSNRYPVIFRRLRELVGESRDVRILSFGCAYGEEVFTLRQYFPHAEIKGIDINPFDIAEAKRRLERLGDSRISFAVGDLARNEPETVYDAICCMAVLRHGDLGRPGVTRCDHLIKFADFEEIVRGFARCLKPGGFLVIRHANFRFEDTDTARDFETVVRVKVPKRAVTPVFDRENMLMAGEIYESTIFRKRDAA